MAVSKKETVKTAAVKTAKTEPVKRVTAKAETGQTAAVKAEAVKKAPAAKKAPAKKTEPKTAIVIEYSGSQIVASDVLAAAKKAFAKANKGIEIKTIDLYVKPEEGRAYYVVNGVGTDDFWVSI